jgi:hypothetical protein
VVAASSNTRRAKAAEFPYIGIQGTFSMIVEPCCEEQLRDAISLVHNEVLLTRVEEDHLDLSPIVRVDDAWSTKTPCFAATPDLDQTSPTW